MMARNKPPLQTIEAEDRAVEAADLYRQGLTYQEIAERLGYAHRSSARRAVDRVRRAAMRDAGEQIVAAELGTINNALDVAEDVMESAHEHGELDVALRGTTAVARLSESRRKLLGTDAPTRSEVDVNGSAGGYPVVILDSTLSPNGFIPEDLPLLVIPGDPPRTGGQIAVETGGEMRTFRVAYLPADPLDEDSFRLVGLDGMPL